MITDIASYLRFFESFRRRTERDVAALPPSAAAWRPPAAEGEAGWSIGQIVAHIGGTRLYFASAYRNEGWLWIEDGDRDGPGRSADLAAVARPIRHAFRRAPPGTRRTSGSRAASR